MPHSRKSLSSQESLERLKEGNARFLAGKPINNQVTHEFLTHLSAQQRPHSIILGCSDSRVPPELVFDQGFGDLFIIRVAGNIISLGVTGSIQYAHLHLGPKLLVVLGHEGCGAVKSTLAAKFNKIEHPERIQKVVDLIIPSVTDIDPKWPLAKQMDVAVEANVRWSMRQIMESPEGRLALQANRDLRIVGAVYELTTGRVRWLDA